MKYAVSMVELTPQLIFVFSQLVNSTAGEREEILEKYIESCKLLTEFTKFLKDKHGYIHGDPIPKNNFTPSPKYCDYRPESITISFDYEINNKKDTTLVMTWSQAARFICDHKKIFAEQEEISAEQNKEVSIEQHHDLLVGILRKIITDEEKKQELINLCEENRAEDILMWVSNSDNIYDEGNIAVGERNYTIVFYDNIDIDIFYAEDEEQETPVTEFSYEELADFILENYKEIFEITEQNEPSADAEKPSGNITYIPIGHLEPHPKNPRKDVGDISELADSIRKNGIMQNLTVVPWFPANPREPEHLEGYYRILIGHRRYAAARSAGLEALPCIIAEGLSMKEQVGIMLAENMQRADLTEPEQVEGFQLMLDLGDTVSSISETTGFSESTIRRRLKMSQYDMEQVKKSYNEGMRLEDFEALEKINDPAVREKLVENYKPNNFRMELENALHKQEKEIWFESAEKAFSEFAEKLPKADYTAYHFIRTVPIHSKVEKIKEIIDFDENKKYYYFNTGYCIDVLTDRDKQQESRVTFIQKPHENVAGLQELCATMEKMRKDFIKNFKAFPCKKTTEILEKIYAIFNLLMKNYDDLYICNIYSIANITDCDISEDEDMPYKEFIERSGTKDLRGLVILAYSMLPVDSQLYFDNFTAEYRENKVGSLRLYYEFLEICGYVISDEERDILDGTHKLYVKEENEV